MGENFPQQAPPIYIGALLAKTISTLYGILREMQNLAKTLDFLRRSEYNYFCNQTAFEQHYTGISLGGTEKIMDGYITAKEAAEKWGVSDRQVQVWCQTGMLEGITKFGSTWAIPITAEKPTRTRKYKPGRKPKNKTEDAEVL